MTSKGVIAAGHAQTVDAAAIMLEEGGNAFDAVLAATFAACVVEPVLSSLGGGGFLMAGPAGGDAPVLYDFFSQTPKRRAAGDDLDFHPITANFGSVTQEFHIGMASIATPGTLKGMFQVHRDLCTLPMARIIEPALTLARKGFTVNRLQAYLFGVVGPIYLHSDASRAIFASTENPEKTRGEGETMTNPDFANTLEAIARDGEDLFYRGEIAATIVRDCHDGGGVLGRDDFESYRVHKRTPMIFDYRGARLFTNPAPSTGGLLIAFALELLNDLDVGASGFGSITHLETLVSAMDQTNRARVESGLREGVGENAAGTLLNPDFLASYKAQVLGRPRAERGTTHISIIDAAGNTAALTLSNGEGAGYIAPATGIMLNNMLGEEDINPAGFHQWQADTRLSSMMAPTLAFERDGRLTALGSGGSNRIRTAILQVLVNLFDFAMSAGDAVEAPRLHSEGGVLNIENGFPDGAIERLIEGPTEHKCWDERNLFFGGVHVARFEPNAGIFTGAGDPRRGGTARIV
ncbi:MAG: gamma-glutamyltransferase [Alphaproteobacteria bacterium]|jgi:gamma-glutamyltranspeptidase / glutathione hydrolase|nr:gamma-glutamyltransferase [Alphaproteobacteria bacterium]MBT7943580.1 gamma-glutamyltransferase [Alphaproteobacteria bacterium]